VQLENQQQASDQVSISNSIGSLRALGALDWRQFVETMSVVEQALLMDPGGCLWPDGFCHPRSLSPRHRRDSQEVPPDRRRGGSQGRRAGACLPAMLPTVVGERARHVGFYLIDQGLPDLERAAAVRHSGAAALCRSAGRFPLPLYLGGIVLLSAIGSAGLLAQALAFGMPAWWLPPLGLLALLAVSHLAVALVNWLATLLVTPHALPRMDFSAGDTGQRAYAGGGADAARQRRERRRSDRGAGGPLPGESRRAPAFRAVDRFSRRPAGIAGC
jgi:cyclic beta-1,2-glucan synthetase